MRHLFHIVNSRVLTAFFVTVVFGYTIHAADEEFTALIGDLKASSTEQKINAIERLSQSGNERVPQVLEALLEGMLFEYGDRIVIGAVQEERYTIQDAVTGENLGEAEDSELDKLTVNNRLRTILRKALGSLNFLNPDVNKREEAIDSILKSRDPETLPALEKAIETEKNSRLRRKMEVAKAAIVLNNTEETSDVLKALEIIEGNPSPELRSLLVTYLEEHPEGNKEIAAAANKARRTIETKLSLWDKVGNIYRGISLGSVLLLAAVGLAITFGVMGVINMAHGEMVMLGAYCTFVVQEWFRASMSGSLDYSLFVAIPFAFLITCLIGIAIEQSIIRFLYGRPLETLLATWGLSLILQQSVRSLFGPTNRDVSNPSWMSGAFEMENGLVFTYNRLWIIVFSIVVVSGVALIMRKTQFGLRMRAVTQNRSMARSMGIRTGRIDALTFGLGSGIAGIAGVALSQIDNVSPNLGQSYIIDSFMVVVFGGVGNIMGTVVGALSLGVFNKFLEPMVGAVLAKILVLIGIILFIQKRPSGLFALQGRAVEN